jgi:hypothetical protein
VEDIIVAGRVGAALGDDDEGALLPPIPSVAAEGSRGEDNLPSGDGEFEPNVASRFFSRVSLREASSTPDDTGRGMPPIRAVGEGFIEGEVEEGREIVPKVDGDGTVR